MASCSSKEGPSRPIRVLSLFDGLGTGRVALKAANIPVEAYFSSEVNMESAMVSICRHKDNHHIGDIRLLTSAQIKQYLTPIDLVIGGSPCDEFSIANPWRLGFYPRRSGSLFYDFIRVLGQVTDCNPPDVPVYYLFENVASMSLQHKQMMSFFFDSEPLQLNARHYTPQNRKRYFWSNIPGFQNLRATKKQSGRDMILQDILMPHRTAQVEKIGCVTSRVHSQLVHDNYKPVVDYKGDASLMWSCELESLFGFPRHYSDVMGISFASRSKMIGQSWSVPVIVEIFKLLKKCY